MKPWKPYTNKDVELEINRLRNQVATLQSLVIGLIVAVLCLAVFPDWHGVL